VTRCKIALSGATRLIRGSRQGGDVETEICTVLSVARLRTGADKSLAFPICSTTKRNFFGWVNEVRTTKS
jgi:hypothetical protein